MTEYTVKGSTSVYSLVNILKFSYSRSSLYNKLCYIKH